MLRLIRVPAMTRVPVAEDLEVRTLLATTMPAAALWATRIEAGGIGAYASAVILDKDGNALIAGNQNATSRIPGTIGADKDAFVSKVDPAGNVLWVQYIRGSHWDFASGIAVDQDGSVYVTGTTSSEDLSGAKNVYAGGDLDAYVAKLTQDGEVLWTKYLGGSGTENGTQILVDREGNVLVTGGTTSTSFQDATGGVQAGAFIAKMSSSGALISVSHSPSAGWAADDQGNRYFVGSVRRGLITVIDEHTNVQQGRDVSVTKFGASGEVLWTNYVGLPGSFDNDAPRAVAVDNHGGVLVAGYFGDRPFYEGDVNKRAFLARFDGDGNLLWTTMMAGRGDEARAISVDATGNVFVIGSTSSPDISGAKNILGGSQDGFLAKVDSSGMLLWFQYIGGSGSDGLTGIVADSRGNVIVAGASDSTDLPGGSETYRGYNPFVMKLAVNGPITASAGDDSISVSSAVVTDSITGDSCPAVQVTVNGVAGQAFVPGGSLLIYGLAGNDTITVDPAVAFPVIIYGGEGNDTITGGAGADTMYGNFGDDVIRGGAGNDSILAGLGADNLDGQGGNDRIWGGDGCDTIYGGAGNDYIEGKGKADTLYGGDGNDTILGQAGNDLIYGETGDDLINVYDGLASTFRDTVYAGAGTDTVNRDVLDVVTEVEVLA